MKQELQQKLFDAYPELWANMKIVPGQPRMPISFGIETGDGWFDIIDGICAGLVRESRRVAEAVVSARKYNWTNLEELTEKMRKTPPPARVAQIKEKFGTLRFYVNSATDADYAVIEFGERMSATTCEDCGNKGEERPGGWIRTQCELCYAEALKYEAKRQAEWDLRSAELAKERAEKLAAALDKAE